MSPAEYFDKLQVAHDRVRIPDAYRDPTTCRYPAR
jgi:hypothetical protein